MKKQIKNIIYISIIFSFLFVSLTPPVYATVLQTKYQQTASKNAAAKNALSWGVQGAKAVSKCAIGFAAKAAINGLTNLVLSLLKIDLTVSVKDQSAQNAAALANCVASVAIGLAKDQIVKITKSTFNWINTGLGGDPLYVANMSNLLNQVENTVISSELSIFRDSQYAEMYPYGRDFASAQIQTQRSMSDHLYGLQSSLFDALTIDDQALNAADKLASYSHNFAQGGWNGWLSLTQNPQNNPLGFNMLATDQLAYQKEVAVVQKKEEVDRGGGVQDKKDCVEYGTTKKGAATTTEANKALDSVEARKEANDLLIEDTQALSEAKTYLSTLQNTLQNYGADEKANQVLKINAQKKVVDDAQSNYDMQLKAVGQADAAYKYTHDSAGKECTKYETVTPGSVIKDQVSKVINSPVVQLEMVRTLDDALGSVLDTLMGKLQDNGIKRIDELFNTEKSTVPSMALNSSGELIMGETGSGLRRTGAFDLKDLGNTYTQVLPGEGNYILNDQGIFIETTGTGGTWTSGTNSGTWEGTGAGTGTWVIAPNYMWNMNSSTGGQIINNGSPIGTWTATTGTGGTGIANWTKNGNAGSTSGTWTDGTNSGTWALYIMMPNIPTTGTFEPLIDTWKNTKNDGSEGTFTGSNGSGTWKATTRSIGGTGIATWISTGDYIMDKKGVIQIQKDYITAANQNITLFNNIMPTLGELDYCIPGPNPNWEQNSQDIDMDLQQTAKPTEGPYILDLKDIYSNYMNKTYGPTGQMLNNDDSDFCVNNAKNPPTCTIDLPSTSKPATQSVEDVQGYYTETQDPESGSTYTTYVEPTTTTVYSCPDHYTLNVSGETCDLTPCANGKINPPTCDKTSNYNGSACTNGATNSPACTIANIRFSSLPMASAGLNLTAGIVQTDVNVTDAKTKYLANIGDTDLIQTELQNIADAYNLIIKDAQDRRATSVGPRCTYPDELIN